MQRTLSPAACELAGRALTTFIDRLPSSERAEIQRLADFLVDVGAIRSRNIPNAQAESIILIADQD